MRTKFYVVADRDGFIRATKRVPSIYRDEVVVSVGLVIPDGCFQPALVAAELVVNPEMVAAPKAELTVLEPPELPEAC